MLELNGARGGSRTPKGFRPLDPKSSASASFATLALRYKPAQEQYLTSDSAEPLRSLAGSVAREIAHTYGSSCLTGPRSQMMIARMDLRRLRTRRP